jgi:hypothetical protein
VRAARTAIVEIRRSCDILQEDLARTQKQFDAGLTLWTTQERLDKILELSRSVTMEEGLREKLRACHTKGTRALVRGDGTEAQECAREMSSYISQARELTVLPAQIGDRLEKIRSLALDESVRTEAETIRREAGLTDGPRLREALRRLTLLEARLEEEYTLVISGGKWRFKNSDPSNRSYYLLVEAQDPAGRAVSRSITNEEDGRTSSVTIWGERVSFAVYERIRKDKQDHGVIRDNIFGRKRRGRMEDEVTLSDDGGPVRRAGQITRW